MSNPVPGESHLSKAEIPSIQPLAAFFAAHDSAFDMLSETDFTKASVI
jgi:hypothetical protein